MPCRCCEPPEPVLVNVMVDLQPLIGILATIDRRMSRIEQKEIRIMATIGDVNTTLDELLKDVRRVLALVQNAPAAAATQAEVDALAARLEALDAEVEAVDPEPTA